MNNDTNSKELRIGAVLSYAQMSIQIIVGLAYTPIMIKLLGQNEYGLYNTVASTISTLSILNLGFNASYVRYYSKYKKNNDQERINSLNGLFISVFLFIGFVALLCGLYLTRHLPMIFDRGLNNSEYETARVLMLLLTVKLAVSFPMGVFSNIISAHEKFVFLKGVGIISTIAGPLVCLPFLLMGYKSIAIVTVSLLIQTANEIVNFYYVVFRLKNRFVFRNYEKGLFKELFTYSGFIALNIFVNQINWNIDKVLLARFCGTAEVAVYSVGYSLYLYYQNFSSSISGVFTPRIHKIVVRAPNNGVLKNQLTALFITVGRIQFFVLALLTTGVVFFGKPFITKLWAGAEYTNSYYVALMLMIPAIVPLTQNIGIEIQRAENKHQFRSVSYAIMALMNLGITLILAPKFGSIGAAFGTALSLIVANGIIMNTFYQKKCHIDILAFWKNILSISKSFVVIVPCGIALRFILNYNEVVQLFMGIIVYTGIYMLSMWKLSMNEYEKKTIKTAFTRIVKVHTEQR